MTAAEEDADESPPVALLPALRCICWKARFWEGTGMGSVRGDASGLLTGRYEGRGEASPGEIAPPLEGRADASFLAGTVPESSDCHLPPPAHGQWHMCHAQDDRAGTKSILKCKMQFSNRRVSGTHCNCNLTVT